MKSLVKRPARRGQPEWLMTFADLMTLLLTFFVLLLSFSEMDVKKYEMMAASLGQAFGISYVAPSPATRESVSEELADDNVLLAPDPVLPPVIPPIVPSAADPEPTKAFERNEELAGELIEATEDYMASGLVDVEYDDDRVLMRFSEQAAFAPGSATLQRDIQDTLEQVVSVLSQCDGIIRVVGHTDNVPILPGRFRSNWDLSSARAVSVVHEMVRNGDLAADRVEAVGRAETDPLEPNTTENQRARNRRVEIHIINAICQ